MYNNYVTYNQKRPIETTHTYTTKPSFPSPHTLKAGKIQNPTWNYRLKEISILGSKSDGGGGGGGTGDSIKKSHVFFKGSFVLISKYKIGTRIICVNPI